MGFVVEPTGTSYRPVRAIGLLLILEVVGLAALGVYEFSRFLSRIDWQRVRPESMTPEVVEAVAVVLFVPPAVLMILSAMGFLFMRRRGWLLAAISQGLCLGVCLWLYVQIQPYYVYPIMAYCVVVILFLNSQDVRAVFHVGRAAAKAKHGGAA
jgi:phosphoglycerol transferase MdoB-like AlkP superfamily enzyme